MVLTAIFIGFSIPPNARADDPYSGYSSSTSYFIDYSNNTGFGVGNTSDVQVKVTIAGLTHDIDVDTGSRGLYMSSDELGASYDNTVAGSYTGEIDLSSSGRVLAGIWSPASIAFTTTTGTITSSPNILDVTTLEAQTNRTAFFATTVNSGFVTLTDNSQLAIAYDSTESAYGVSISGTQAISYAQNAIDSTHNIMSSSSNMGIGFDLSGAPGGTGPVGDNVNQIANPLLNVAGMQSGTLVAGYVVTTTGIQLGLTGTNTGYAYTKLNPTGFASTNSAPDWQTPMGQTTVSGTTNLPGSVVMDSGIPNAFISAPGLSGTLTTLSVSLMNSGGAAGYNIDLSGTSAMNPTEVQVVAPATNGIYSQNQPPYQAQFFNSGRNVFNDFNMLYDAQDGYMGVLTNSYGATDPNVFFTAQPGGFIDPVPESQTVSMLIIGALLLLLPLRIRQMRKSAETKKTA